MPLQFESVSLDRLQANEDFRISFHPWRRDLPGVAQFGILQPVLLFEEKDQWQVVCGFRRVQAARSARLATIPALICRDWEPKQVVLLSLMERLSHGPLNDMERARSVEKFSRNGWSRQEVSQRLFPLLGLKFNPMLLEQLESLLGLPPEVQERVGQGEVYLYTAHRLSRWAPHQGQIAEWFSALKLGVNRQRELLDLMDDVVSACGLQKAVLIEDLEGIRSRCEPQQVYPAWLQNLKCRRYPRLSRAQREFEENRARLRLPGEIQLAAPPFFEEDRYRVSFAFGSREEMERCARKLLAVAGSPELEAILRLL